jgi:hypothetical protein
MLFQSYDRVGHKETYRRNEKNDQSVLNHINKLVEEEEHLFGKNQLTGEYEVGWLNQR